MKHSGVNQPNFNDGKQGQSSDPVPSRGALKNAPRLLAGLSYATLETL